MYVSPISFSSVNSVSKLNKNTHKQNNPSFGMKMTEGSKAGLNEVKENYWENYSSYRINQVFDKINKLDSGDIKLRLIGVIDVDEDEDGEDEEEAIAYRFVKGDKQSEQYYCTEESPEAFYNEVVSDLADFKKELSKKGPRR